VHFTTAARRTEYALNAICPTPIATTSPQTIVSQEQILVGDTLPIVDRRLGWDGWRRSYSATTPREIIPTVKRLVEKSRPARSTPAIALRQVHLQDERDDEARNFISAILKDQGADRIGKEIRPAKRRPDGAVFASRVQSIDATPDLDQPAGRIRRDTDKSTRRWLLDIDSRSRFSAADSDAAYPASGRLIIQTDRDPPCAGRRMSTAKFEIVEDLSPCASKSP